MKTLVSRILATAMLAAIAMLLLVAATPSKGTIAEPDKLVILSTTDVKGMTSACG